MTSARCKEILNAAAKVRVLVVGDLILDHFVWGRVARISPEAPVPVVDYVRENCMPGGAGNVASNLAALGGRASIFGITGRDGESSRLGRLLKCRGVDVRGLVAVRGRHTSTKMRIVAGQQQITRLDRETIAELDCSTAKRLERRLEIALARVQAVIVGDYGKGVISQRLLDRLREGCRERGVWLSLDPKPTRTLDLSGLSLLTPNRREAFELAGVTDTVRHPDPMQDRLLQRVAEKLLEKYRPTVLLITLSELGMLLCMKNHPFVHIPTMAREIFDVSGAGDTVIASFTLAVVSGASPEEAAIFSNHAAGVVVGKVGTAEVSPSEILWSFSRLKQCP